MKVTVCTRIPIDTYMGGIATVLNKYIDNKSMFYENGVDISLFSWHDEKVEKIKNSKIRNILYWKSLWKASLNYCRNNKPDLFHIHTAREFMFLRDVIIGRSIARRTGTKCALTVHVGAIETVFNRIPKFLHKYLIKSLNRYFCMVFFLSNRIMESFISKGLNGDKCCVLYNFHDMPLVDSKDNNGVVNLLFVGAIQREKGIIEVMNAFNLLKNESCEVHLDICGLVNDSSVKKRFDDYCKENTGTVTVHGYVTGREKEQLFRSADILLLPSYHEGFPLVVLEAIASRCAIVTTRVGALPEILRDENVIWVEIGSTQSLLEALKRIIEDTALLRDMQKKNRKLAEEFTLGKHIQKLCSIYDSL